MKEITEISDNPKQQFSFQLENGKLITIKLYFISSQIGWFFDLEYEGVASNCHRVTNTPNIIREKRNIYPFGIGCSITDGEEAWFVDDFSTRRASLYVLEKDNVELVEKELYGKIF